MVLRVVYVQQGVPLMVLRVVYMQGVHPLMVFRVVYTPPYHGPQGGIYASLPWWVYSTRATMVGVQYPGYIGVYTRQCTTVAVYQAVYNGGYVLGYPGGYVTGYPGGM